jgi:two-component system, NtrC family, sensor histidine kinase HydH
MSQTWQKVLFIAVVMTAIVCLLYLTSPAMRYEHAVYRMLFYFPVVLAGIWFGLKGTLYVTLSSLIFYIPYLIGRWEGLSYRDFTSLLEMILYFGVVLLLGFFIERERKRQSALRQTESLAMIGRTVSELAHDMKTPLIAIHGLVNQVIEHVQGEISERKKLEVAIQESIHLESIVEEMLDFGKPFELQWEQISLNAFVRECMEVAEPIAEKKGVVLKSDLLPSLSPVSLDPRRTKQAVLNLITNAIEASPFGGDVLVTTRATKGEVVLDVMDKGPGITEIDSEVVFAPFYSKKRGGTGLGLSIVKKIATAHGGDISFHPNSPRGMTFTLRFPLHTGE